MLFWYCDSMQTIVRGGSQIRIVCHLSDDNYIIPKICVKIVVRL